MAHFRDGLGRVFPSAHISPLGKIERAPAGAARTEPSLIPRFHLSECCGELLSADSTIPRASQFCKPALLDSTHTQRNGRRAGQSCNVESMVSAAGRANLTARADTCRPGIPALIIRTYLAGQLCEPFEHRLRHPWLITGRRLAQWRPCGGRETKGSRAQACYR